MNTTAAQKTYDYVRNTLQYDRLDAFKARFEHTVRVAEIGRQIAREEGFDEEAMYIACLLHDVGYVNCKVDADYDHHGKISADMARIFLEGIAYPAELVEAICYGIEIHTEHPRDYRRVATPFELSVADADNIDRFDAYRMYLNLHDEKLEAQTPETIMKTCERRIGLYTNYLTMPVGTATARTRWDECLKLQIAFYKRLKQQMVCTSQGIAEGQS